MRTLNKQTMINMKRLYIKPTMREVKLQHHYQILAGSNFQSVYSPDDFIFEGGGSVEPR